VAGAVGRRSEIANARPPMALIGHLPGRLGAPGLAALRWIGLPCASRFRVESQISMSFYRPRPGRAAPELRDMGLSMGPLSGPLLVSLLSIYLALPASAQDRLPAGERSEPNAASSDGPAVLTGKERLGKKWMDEQRIDNCKVPIDKRGSKPRPSTCPQTPTG
jgi:hypothetical protein